MAKQTRKKPCAEPRVRLPLTPAEVHTNLLIDLYWHLDGIEQGVSHMSWKMVWHHIREANQKLSEVIKVRGASPSSRLKGQWK